MLFFKVQLQIFNPTTGWRKRFKRFFSSKFSLSNAEIRALDCLNHAQTIQVWTSQTVKRKTQISADLLENFRRAGRVCLWVLIIYEAKRCLFCLRTFGRLSLSIRSPASSPPLSAREKKNYSSLKCALNSLRWSSGNFSVSYLLSLFSSKRELSVAWRYAMYFIASSMTSIWKTQEYSGLPFGIFLSPSRRQSVTRFKVSYLRNTRPWSCGWNKWS